MVTNMIVFGCLIVLFMLNLYELRQTTNTMSNWTIKETPIKSIREIDAELFNYLQIDRHLIVDKMNEAHSTIDHARNDLKWYDNKIKSLNDKFFNGVSADEAEEVSSMYFMYKEERKDVIAELKKAKNDFSHYSHILSIIDTRIYG